MILDDRVNIYTCSVNFLHQSRVGTLADYLDLPLRFEFCHYVACQHRGSIAEFVEVERLALLLDQHVNNGGWVIGIAEVHTEEMSAPVTCFGNTLHHLYVSEYKPLDLRLLSQSVYLPQGEILAFQALNLVYHLLLQEWIILVGADEMIGTGVSIDLAYPVFVRE